MGLGHWTQACQYQTSKVFISFSQKLLKGGETLQEMYETFKYLTLHNFLEYLELNVSLNSLK